MLRITNLSGLFTGAGFEQKDGRHPKPDDCGFVGGPIEIVCSGAGTIERIVQAGGSPAVRAADAANEVVDGTGLFATAGFIDAHTHALFAGRRGNEFFERWQGKTYREISDADGGIHRTVRCTTDASDGELCRALIERLTEMLAAGTTVAEVKSGYAATAADELRLLRLIKQAGQSASLPRIIATFLGLHAVPSGRAEQDYVAEIVAALETVASERLATFVDSFPEQGFFSRSECERFTRAAHGRGLNSKVHAEEITSQGTTALFVRLGATSVDHLEQIDDDAVATLAASNTTAVLLPATSLFLGIGYAPARKLIDSGARVAVATDFNPGSAPACDLQLAALLAAAQMRMTAAEILCAITYNAATALRLETSHGSLSPGKSADILLWNLGTDSSFPSDGTALLEEIFVRRLRPRQIVLQGKPFEAVSRRRS
ncbi:MAG TPA: imidazolonepropionase [Pirellulales bacterium]|nr:imidazolonepropionase [Pirellulales bacterium]